MCLKLNAGEIDRLHRARVSGAGDPKEGVQQEFRQIVLDRTKSYLASGARHQVSVSHLDGALPLFVRTPPLANYLDRFPHSCCRARNRFTGQGNYVEPDHQRTQVTILRQNGDGPLRSAGDFARCVRDQYTGGSLVLSSLVRGPNSPANQRYLVYESPGSTA